MACKRKFKTILAFIGIIAFTVSTPAQKAGQLDKASVKAAKKITAKRMKDYLTFIASDEMEGRATPSRGLDTIAKFIGMNLSLWGFKPAGDDDSFYQKIALRQETIDTDATIAEISGRQFKIGEDFIRIRGGDVGKISGSAIFVGDGWMIKAKNVNPYRGIDARGKFLVAYLEGEPSEFSFMPLPAGISESDLTGERGKDWTDVISYARNNEAAGVIILPTRFWIKNWSESRENFGGAKVSVEKFNANKTGQNIPILLFSERMASALFQNEIRNPLLDNKQSVFDLREDKIVSLNFQTESKRVWTQNVVAIWEGSDPKLKNEMVAVSAHYDHIGMTPQTGCAPAENDNICNGADDDGSGTTALLSMAEAFSKTHVRPKRSILFVWHCGEERGLWGSQYFTTYPTVDLKNVIAQLNIDMIGRSRSANDNSPENKELSSENTIYVIGSQMMSSQLGNLIKDVNDTYLKLNYDTRYDDPKDPNRFFYRSDHFNYARKSIPITFWFDGIHADYHQPADEPEKIDYVKMEKVTRTIFLTLWKLADVKERPKIDKQLPAELTGN